MATGAEAAFYPLKGAARLPTYPTMEWKSTMKVPRRAKQRERQDDALSHSTMVMIKDYTVERQGASNLFGKE